MRSRKKSIAVPLLSQFNMKRWKASQTWCGRTAGAMLYNYYAIAHGKSEGDFIVNNQEDGRTFDLIFPDGTNAVPGWLATHPLIHQHPGGEALGKRFQVDAVPLYPKRGRPAHPPSARDIDTLLAPLLDYIDHNNPALFGSGLSRGNTGNASHFILVAGYEYDEAGELWLEIAEPSRNHTIVAEVEGGSLVRVLDGGAYHRHSDPHPESDCVPTRGSRYMVKAEFFFRPNPHLVGKGNWRDAVAFGEPPDPILFCDNDQNFSGEDGFAVLLARPVPDTPDNRLVSGDAGLRLPISAELSTDWTRYADPNAPFPIGGNRAWHSAIRVLAPDPPTCDPDTGDAATSELADDKVWSIGEGALVAVRFPEEPVEEGTASAGMVLVRHELDPETKTLLAPAARDGAEPEEIAAARRRALPFYSLYMHLGPLSELLHDGRPTVERSPRWLREVGPAALPPLERFVPEGTALSLSTWADAAYSESVALPMLHLNKTPKLSYEDDGPKIGGIETVELDLGERRLVVPSRHGTAQHPALARVLGPSLEHEQDRHFYNPLTDQLIPVSYTGVRLAAGTPLEVREAPTLVQQAFGALGVQVGGGPRYELDVLTERDGFCYVKVADDPCPGFDKTVLPKSGWRVEPPALSIPDGQQVTLKAEVGESLRAAATLVGPGHLMRFSGVRMSGGELPDEVGPDLLPCVELSATEATSKIVPTQRPLFYFNALTEQVIQTSLEVDAETALVLDRTRPAVVAEEGGVRYARVTGFRAVLDIAGAGGVIGEHEVLRFDRNVNSVRLYAKTERSGAARRYPDDSRTDLANSELSLAFEIVEQGETSSRYRYWPRLPSVAKLSKDEVKRIDRVLEERSPAMPALERLRDGHGLIYAVELGTEHGFALDEAGRVVAVPPPEGEEVTRHVCAVIVEGGQLILHRVEGETGPHPLALEAADGLAIHPLFVTRDDSGPVAAYFEVIQSVATDAPSSNQTAIDDETSANEPRQALLDRLASGALEVFEEPVRIGAEWIGMMGETGAGRGVHVEVFAGTNLVDSGVEGTDDTLTLVPGSTWGVLRDDDAVGQFTSSFVKTMFDQLVLCPDLAFDTSGLPEEALEVDLDGEPDGDEWIPSTAEWIELCNRPGHPRQLARLIACHALYWRAGTKDLLSHADARNTQLSEAEIDSLKSEIDRLAWADDVQLDATADSSMDPSAPAFHYHPLRFVEWLKTGIDVDATEYGAGSQDTCEELTVTADIGSATGLRLEALPGHPYVFRLRTPIGDVATEVDATLHLEGFGMSVASIPTAIERGSVRRIRLTRPRIDAAARVSPSPVELSVPVSLRDRADACLLADGGLLAESGLGHALVSASAFYNVDPPERVEATLSSSAFRFLDGAAPEGYDVEVAGDKVVFTHRGEEEVQVVSARSIPFSVSVATGESVGESTTVTFAASGGDFEGSATATVSTRELRRDAALVGNDVVKLQLLLSQISARDGRPCYRYITTDVDYPAKGASAVNADGDYGRALSRGIWRFIDAYVEDTKEVWEADVRFLKDEDNAETTVRAADLRADPHLSLRLSGKRRDYPIVDGPLLHEIVRRFDARYMTPLARFTIASVDAASFTGPVFAVRAELGKRLDSSVACSAILPSEHDAVHGVLELSGLVEDSYEVTLKLAPGSHYQLLAGGAPAPEQKVRLERANPRSELTLVFSGNSEPKEEPEVLEALSPDGKVLGSIPLAGVRDLTSASVPGRDIVLLQHYLSQIRDTKSATVDPCYRYRKSGRGPVVLDGAWGSGFSGALARFGAIAGGPYAYPALVEEIYDAYVDATYNPAGIPGISPGQVDAPQ